jgi:hypothetical protein
MPSPLFSTLTYLTTFTAGVIGTVTLTVKDKFENNISLNSFNDSMAFVSKISLSNESDEFISFPVSLSGSTHTFQLSFTASGVYRIPVKVLDRYFLDWKLFSNSVCAGSPIISGVETLLKYNWGSSSIHLNGMPIASFTMADGMSVEWSGYFLSRNSGGQTFIDCSGQGGIRIIVNGKIAADRFMFPNNYSTNQQFSVRAVMTAASSWNSLKIQYRDVSGAASIFCSGFGELGSSYFTVGNGAISVSSNSLTFSQSQSLVSGTTIYVFSEHVEAWRTSAFNGFAKAMPIYRGTLSSDCNGLSCTSTVAAVDSITSQRFFYLLPTSTVEKSDIDQATSLVYGMLVSVPRYDEFVVAVEPSSPCASFSRLTRPQVISVTTGATTNYNIQCFDDFANACNFCEVSFVISQARPYFSLGTISQGGAGSLHSSISLVIPAPISTQVFFSVSTLALAQGFLACTYYSSSFFSNSPIVSGFQFPQVLSTKNPASGLPATFYGTYFVRWEGYFRATSTDLYSIRASSNLNGNEKLRIWIDDTTIIDSWNVISSAQTGIFSAQVDHKYLLKIDFEASHSNPSRMILDFATTSNSNYASIPSGDLFAALHIIGSPFSIAVNPVFGNVSSIVVGPGLSVATAGVISRFTVTLKDSILSSTFVNASLMSSLFWTASNKRPWHDFSVSISQTATGIYSATYNVTRSGTFFLEIICRSITNTSTSFANSVCNSGASIPLFSVIVNPGYAGHASNVSFMPNITVGALQTVSILSRDSFGNNISGDGSSFFRVTVSNGHAIHTVPQTHILANIYEVRYRVSASGRYLLQIQALIPGLSKFLIKDSMAGSYSSTKTTVSSVVLDFSESAKFKFTSSSEAFYLMRYSGFIRPQITGIHTFWISNVDSTKRHRTWLGDRYIVDSWRETSAATEFSAIIGLSSNAFYELFIDFSNSEKSEPALTLSLQWEFLDNPRSNITSTRIFQPYQNVSYTPFFVTAYPRAVCASACILSGMGLSLATSGEASSFTILMRDEFSNPTTLQAPTFIVQIVGDATLMHHSKALRNGHGTFQSAAHDVLAGTYVPAWKKGPPASYYSSASLFEAFRNFNPYSGSPNDAAYWPYAYGGLFATAYAGPHEQIMISAAVPNGIHATYYSRLNNDGVISRLSNNPAAQDIVSYISAAAGFKAGRFQGFFQATFQGIYTFQMSKPPNQSSRLWMDGILLLNDWVSPSQNSLSGTVYLSLSPHSPMFSIIIEYDTADSPSISLNYACDQSSLTSIPSASYFLRFDIPARTSGTPGSLSATFYDSNTCETTKAIASVFDGSYFSFSSTSSNSVPVPGAWSTNGTFSARWKGFVIPPRTDLFTFFLTKGDSREHARLLLDNVLTIDNPSGSTSLMISKTYVFNHVPKSERMYSIVVEYGSLNSVTTKKLQVSWSNAGLSTIPFLFSPSSTPRFRSHSIIIPEGLISSAYLSTEMTNFQSDSSFVSPIYQFGSIIGCESSPGMSVFACATIQLRIGTPLRIR